MTLSKLCFQKLNLSETINLARICVTPSAGKPVRKIAQQVKEKGRGEISNMEAMRMERKSLMSHICKAGCWGRCDSKLDSDGLK